MTSRLTTLRSRLGQLRRARAALRTIAAWSALASSIIVALAAIFLLDVVFHLAIPQRLVVLLLATAGVGWAFWRFTRPFLGQRESEIEMALLVERQQRIDSDLVAALQFETPAAESWGSTELAAAVVSRIATASPGINVFDGLSRKAAIDRASFLAVSLAVALLAAAVFPGHMAAFVNRLFFGSAHYPTRTAIDQILVNHTRVFENSNQAVTPTECKAAQGRPLSFLVQCSGRFPASGSVSLTAADAAQGRTRLTLRRLSLDERLLRLRDAAAKLSEARQSASSAILPTWRDEFLALIHFDAPAAAAPLVAAKTPGDLAAAASAVATAIDQWPANAANTAVLMGELPRLNENVTFKVTAGDARTEAARVRMIPLPIVELTVTPVPPKYAAREAVSETRGRQLAVIERSSVAMKLECFNGKPLKTAWLTVPTATGLQSVDLLPHDRDRTVWTLPPDSLLLSDIRRDLRYEVQVVDMDGLSLEAPLRGQIRIRPDQPPTSVAEVIHKVALPTATPVVAYRAADDFGISGLTLVVDIERGGAKPAANSSNEDASLAPAPLAPSETHRFIVPSPTGAWPLSPDSLPLTGNFPLSLSPLDLIKGDRIKLTLEAIDYRGENDQNQATGQPATSDSLVLEISDENGVLAAIGEPDQKSAQQLTEIIKRQLGIGEESK